MPFGIELTIIALMLALNAIFAAYEMALASISISKINQLVAEKKKGSNAAFFMKNRMEASLAIVQVGITLVGAIAAAVGGSGVEGTFAPYIRSHWHLSEPFSKIIALGLLIAPLTLITIIFAELVPKIFALNSKEEVVLSLSPIMKYLAKIAYPIVFILEATVKKIIKLFPKKSSTGPIDERIQRLHELRAFVSLARTSRLFGAREEKIVMSAAQLSMRPVRDIITPASDIFMINIGSSLSDAFVKAHLDMHTRFPVCEKEADPQSIQGYINFKDIMVALKINPENPTIRGITRPIMKLNEKLSISQVLEKMMLEKTHIAIIASKENITLGMITLEDIVEELVGEIEDEFDRALTHIQQYGTSWIMGGGVLMSKVIESLGIDWPAGLPKDTAVTLSDWCAGKLGRPVSGGEFIESDNIRVMPRKFRRKKMVEAMVSIMPLKP